MKIHGKISLISVVAVFVCVVANLSGAPLVSNVSMMQRNYTRLMDISYTLANAPAIVTVSILTNGVALPSDKVTLLSGSAGKVVNPGSHTIVWDAGKDFPEQVTTNTVAHLTAWAVDAAPDIMVVDLGSGPNTTFYPVRYFNSVDSLPYGGIQDNRYRTEYLVMRKIPAGRYNKGSGIDMPLVIFTKPFYIGVYEVTQGHWFRVRGDYPGFFTNQGELRPVEQVAYVDIRGADLGSGWPGTGTTPDARVDEDSFMWLLRDRTGLDGFDLPTSAQWEYACRAGTLSEYSDGDFNATQTGAMEVLGRYNGNSGYSSTPELCTADATPDYGTAIVGKYPPNSWGLYDLHGNIWEWVLDWENSSQSYSTATDPPGPVESTTNRRLRRSGSWNDSASNCKTVYASGYHCAVTDRYNNQGLRVVCNLP